MLYRIEVFVQGHGWTPLAEIYHYGGPTSSYEDAVKLALSAILDRMSRGGENYGSKLGDLVGFRILETNEEVVSKPPPTTAEIVWDNYKHLFYRRGDAYMLYKSWSWPD